VIVLKHYHKWGLASTNDVEFAAYKIEGDHLCNSIPSKYFILLMDQNVREFLGKIAEVPQNFTLTLLLRIWLQS
jgi:hypothetical protein